MKFSDLKNEELKVLIERVRDNDLSSLIKVIDLFKPYILSLATSYNNFEYYNECLSELLVLLTCLDLNKSNLKAYIKRCLSNYCKRISKKYVNHLKWEDYMENLFATEKDYIEENLIELKLENFNLEKKKLLNKITKNLMELDKKIFLAFYLENKSVKEIVKFYNLSESTIYSKLKKTTENVKQYVRKEGVI